jgi:hypothetical protein
MKHSIVLALAISLLAACAGSPRAPEIPPHRVIAMTDAKLDPEYWIRRGANSRVVLDEGAIAAQNARLKQLDRSVYDLEKLPRTLTAGDVRAWIGKISARPGTALYDEFGQALASNALDALEADLNLEGIPATQATRFGLVVRRADLRTFPTTYRVFSEPDDGTDIDRFQEDALFAGTPVAILHQSRDGRWLFVVSPRYAAWIDKRFVAEGTADEVFAYTRKEPYVVVTGARVRTVFTPERPEVSELALEMGQRVPLLADWPADKPVNGQSPYTSYVVELPMRSIDDGSLHFTPALLQRNSDVAEGYLPLTRENLVRQSFKFLGERYGWGHSYNSRDCSGFVSEVYRSFGVQLPRNTRDQGVSAALNRIAFTADDDHAKRLAVLRDAQVGDLIYIPGHVMMVVGQDGGGPYVIHDTTGITYRDADGVLTRVHLNGVAVTPLLPLLDGPETSRIDRIYSIQRIRK